MSVPGGTLHNFTNYFQIIFSLIFIQNTPPLYITKCFIIILRIFIEIVPRWQEIVDYGTITGRTAAFIEISSGVVSNGSPSICTGIL